MTENLGGIQHLGGKKAYVIKLHIYWEGLLIHLET